MSDEIEVLSLLGRYCRAMDGPDVSRLLDCYTHDGVFQYYAADADEPLLDLHGHEQLTEWFAHHRETTPIGSQTHVSVNPSIAVDGSTASASSTYLSVREAPGGAIVITATGTNADRIVLEDGRARFAERICRAFMPRRDAPA
jgi:hypothetical protein